jgi:hypothetical protein
MLNDYTVANEANELVDTIRRFWNNSVSEIKVVNMTDKPYDMFTLSMKMYGKFDVLMEYDRGTLSINVKMQDQFIVLSRLTNEQVYRGFEGYKPENLLHNFATLDKVLQSM